MAKNNFKKIVRKIHLWLGLSSGLVVFITALSGCLLSFEDELDSFFSPEIHIPNQYTDAKVGLDSIAETIHTAYPNYSIKQLFLFSDPHKTYLVRAFSKTKEERLLSVNPYTGAIQKNVNFNNRFFIKVLHLHRYLLVDGVGQIINGISTLCFIILLVSGFIIWLPKKTKYLKQRLLVKWNASTKRVNWDLHNALGFYVIPFAFIIGITGLVWSFDWVENSLYFIFDGKPKQTINFEKKHIAFEKVAQQPLSLDNIKSKTDSIFNFEGNLRFIFENSSKAEKIRVIKEQTGTLIPNKRSQLYISAKTGEILKILPYRSSTTGQKVRRMIYPIHTGTIFGWPSRILICITSLVVASLFITGFFIWYNKNYGKKKKKSNRIR
ncbi:PepSY-associated TM helix domain-containing protein [Zunongwangia sp.]|uniref:PepSY-associated TM helix domain-containing protein n=1 Tax=Zunongwangia sp. TaxID=1965325 RepID=UPI003AA937EA